MPRGRVQSIRVHRRKQPVAGFALQLLLAVAVIHNGIAGSIAAEPETMAGDSMAMTHQGHVGMHDNGETGGSGGTSDCCDDPGCGCGCAAPQACLVTIAYSGSAPAQFVSVAPFSDGLPPLAGLTAPFRPPA